MLRIARETLIVGVAAGATAGCGSNDRRDASSPPPGKGEWQMTRPAPTTSYTRDRALPAVARPTLVKQGRTPLVYLVETGDPIVIVVSDLTTNVRLASIPVGGRTIVRVESANGVFVGADNVTPGPLDASHQYGIYVEAESHNIMRNETIGPAEEIKPKP